MNPAASLRKTTERWTKGSRACFIWAKAKDGVENLEYSTYESLGVWGAVC
ncbi:hypothetical protein BBO01nite_51070 [Brevibacillus borstelensis]|nr:hypothetical protein BBO01nite_51070 [Brevibacillus borstelensis]